MFFEIVNSILYLVAPRISNSARKNTVRSKFKSLEERPESKWTFGNIVRQTPEGFMNGESKENE